MKEYIMIKVTKEYKEELKKEARENGMTLSAFIKSIVNNRKK